MVDSGFISVTQQVAGEKPAKRNGKPQLKCRKNVANAHLSHTCNYSFINGVEVNLQIKAVPLPPPPAKNSKEEGAFEGIEVPSYSLQSSSSRS